MVTDAGDGITCDCADWAEARLIRDPGAKPVPATAVDVAPFGRVMSWDPKRMTGTAASRIEEFPTADLAPGREILPDSDGSLLVPEWDGCRLHRLAMVREQAAEASVSGTRR